MKVTLLVIEFGIKNIEQIKKKLKFELIEVIYASSFLDVVDTIYQKSVNFILFSDYRGEISTIGYIKMFKKTNSDFKIIVISNEKVINDTNYSYLLQKQADDYISCYDVELISDKIVEFYEKIKNTSYKEWKESTKNVIMYLKINFKNKYTNILKELSQKTDYSISSICHNIVSDTGKTVVEWLTFYRIEGAKELLVKTNFPIRYVGEMVGYRTIQGFIKSFKKLECITPKEFRIKNSLVIT
ncbi:MAG TPA: helix-turn-helix transcriptional regulator [Spirochaetota bacterium]|nr:helix-turn-helix transcriptional regulator [Spirochaetota bacterium]